MPFSNKNNFESLQELIATQLSDSFRKAQGSIDVARPVADDLTAVPNQYMPFNAEDLYQRLVMANLDAKGNMASCYGNYGKGVIVTAGFEFADLFCPGLASISLSAGFSAQQMSSALLIIQRNMPKLFAVGGKKAKPKAVYNIPFPVTYLTMSGKKSRVSLKVSADFKLGKIFEKDKDKPESLVAAGLQLELTANANAEIKGVGMHVLDPSPGLYPHWMDTGLQIDFKNSLGPVNADKLKQQITNYYDYIVGYAIQKLSHSGDPNLTQLKTQFAAIARTRNLEDKIKKLSIPAVKNAVSKVLNEEQKTKKYDEKVAEIWEEISSTDLKEQDFQSLKELFWVWATATQGHDKELNTIIETLEWDIQQLAHAEKDPSAASLKSGFFNKIGDKLEKGTWSNSKLLKTMSYLTYSSFIATAGTSASVSFGGNFAYDGKGSNAQVKLNSALQGQMGFSTYRYQTFSNYQPSSKTLHVKGNIIYTQDVAITYRQVIASAAAGITVHDKINKKLTGKYTYNQVTYTAAQAYWLLEREASMRPTNGAFNLLPGSGVSYGFSVRPEALSDLCQNITKVRDTMTFASKAPKGRLGPRAFYKLVQADYEALEKAFVAKASPFDKQLLKSIAAALKVTDAQVVEFLDGSSFQEVDKSNLNNLNAILLESNYRITDPSIRIQTDTKSTAINSDKEVKVTDDLLETVAAKVSATLPPASATPSKIAKLGSIRIRFRTADYTTAEQTKFKLGIKLGADIGIELKSVSETGLDGIIDVYTYWFPPFRHLFGDPTDDVLESQMVPPVSLFFQ